MRMFFQRLRARLEQPEYRWIIRTVVAVVLVIVIVVAGTTAWYGFRVWTELGPRPWENPTKILARDDSVIIEIYGDRWYPAEPVTLDGLPEYVPRAFLAAEDVRFRRHIGIDPWGIGRAALTNLRVGGVAQGGSTITQQVAKTRFLSSERTLRRKAVEALVAIMIELRLSKDEILSAYLNDVYLGHHDGRSILGIDEAARVYFDTSADDLSVAQAALLAAMVRAPNQEDEDLLRRRRDAILTAMSEQEWLTEEELETASNAEIAWSSGDLARPKNRYYLNALRAELVEEIGARRLRGGALTIRTAADPAMQSAAVDAVVGGVDRLRSRHSWLRRSEDPLQAALLSVDAETGGVRALVGGVSYVKSQFDRTRKMKRQPGSAVKPLVYAAAIEDRDLTPASILLDEPVEIELSRRDIWKPHNYDERFRGEVTVREALEKSLNVPVVRVAEDVGVRRVRSMFRDAGLRDEHSNTPAIALGVDEVSMWDLVGAYTTFPNLGRRKTLHFVETVESSSGRTIYEFDHEGEEILSPQSAYILHSMMRGVVERGTASSLRGRGLGAVAGKTGTTSDYRDAWFVGYAPDLVTATWVGFDEGAPLRVSSAEAALPMWARYMGSVEHRTEEIAPPEGISFAKIERSSGLLWRSGCGRSIEEAFLEGTEPEQTCQPRRRPEPEPEPFLEPSVISIETLRKWLDEAPGVESIEVEEMPADEAPPGSEPGDILIDVPPQPDERPSEREPVLDPPNREAVPQPVPVPVPIPPAEDDQGRRPEPGAREVDELRPDGQKALEKERREREKEQRKLEREAAKEQRKRGRDNPPGRR